MFHLEIRFTCFYSVATILMNSHCWQMLMDEASSALNIFSLFIQLFPLFFQIISPPFGEDYASRGRRSPLQQQQQERKKRKKERKKERKRTRTEEREHNRSVGKDVERRRRRKRHFFKRTLFSDNFTKHQRLQGPVKNRRESYLKHWLLH
jgi:hypothetical protein